ncbi:MAG: hypothetical protein RL173_968 [Fibrobacterota bacterium]|jgi:hypothetical protein
MKPLLRALLTLVLAGLFAACNDRIAGGTNDETHTEIAARFLEPGGKDPVAGALVQVVPHDGVVVVATGRTDSAGRPSIASLPDGLYTVSVAKNGNVAFVDSVPVSSGRLVLLDDDTLGAAGSLSGMVSMQPDHDPASVTVNVLGTDIWTNVSTDGKFRLEGLGAGRFRLRFLTTLPDYTITYLTATVRDGFANAVPDTVRMVFTGIPVVTGLSVRNDTLTGDQILSWRPVAYRGLQDYIVYRDTAGALAPSRVRFATVADTVWRDTAASRGTSVAKWKYRVAVETMTGDTGKWFGSVTGTSVPRALSRLDRGTWGDVGRSWKGELYEIDGKMTEIVVTRTGTSVDVGIRSSSDGLLWDSVGIGLPARKSGQEIQWVVGAGAGRIWCLGHTLLGDGVDVRSSVDGKVWTDSSLADSLWPSLTGTFTWMGSANRAAFETPTGTGMVFENGIWMRAALPARAIGQTDSVVYSMGGGSHLLALSWMDRSRILSDEGVPPFAGIERVVEWNGTLAALAGGRLWIRDPAGWTLRRPIGLNRLTTFGDKLLLSDSTGVLRTYGEAP